MKDIYILGVETSCDETAASIVKNGQQILSNVIHTQIKTHEVFGGVVPELASRKHIENIIPVVSTAFEEAGMQYKDIDAVAVTNRPGLIGALLVGVAFAKSFAYALQKPLIAVNHIEGHIYANILENPQIEFPAICLVVSGGHTTLYYMKDISQYEVIGESIDDAAGEAFDKVARFMGLGYPGGPLIQKAAELGKPGVIDLPRVWLKKSEFDFSFSGLKTATMNAWKKVEKLGDEYVYHLSAEFQAAVVDVLVEKTVRAGEKYEVKTLLLAGGVAANQELRKKLKEKAESKGFDLYYPPLILCTDNAAMVAGIGYQHYLKENFASLNLSATSARK